MLNNSRYLSIIGLLTTMLLILPCISQAGGLYINEFGTPRITSYNVCYTKLLRYIEFYVSWRVDASSRISKEN